MRALIVIAASLAGLVAGAAMARAADIAVEPYEYGGYGVCCELVYGPNPPVIILDNDPGVVLRRWWLPPWRNMHYYPHGGPVSKARGRRHHAARVSPRPAPSYVRYWTNPPMYGFRPAPLIGPDYFPPLPRVRRIAPPPPPPVAAP